MNARRRKPHGRGRGSLGVFARTLFVKFAEAVEDFDEVARPLSMRSLHGMMTSLNSIPTPYDQRFRRAVMAYRKHGLIHLGSHQVRLTPEGRIRWKTYQLEELELGRPKRWDGRWRILIWDVPERKREARNALRSLLKRLGFVQIQQSVWVVPWPCRDEVDFIRDTFNLGPSLLYLESDRVDGAQALRDRFNLG